MSKVDLDHCAHDAASFLKGLASPHRLLILCSLLEGEKCVSDLLEEVSISQPLLSQHLKVLKTEGVLQTRREAQKIYYSILDPTVRSIFKALQRKFQ